MKRKETIEVPIASKIIGGNNPILIQSMTNTKTKDIDKTVEQIKGLEEAGVDIVRMSIPDIESAEAIHEIKSQVEIPLVADIHFNHELALKSIENGIDKLRINPGNIGSQEKIERVVKAAQERNIPIRIGVNAGSLEKHILEKYKKATPEALVESAMDHIRILEDLNFDKIVVSLKASTVLDMIKANRILSQKVNYPLHLGVTEAGLPHTSMIKSAIGIGTLLEEGIGDTIRVSITGEPKQEVEVAQEILKSLELETSKKRAEIIACPTCARTDIDLIKIANEVDSFASTIDKDIKIAVMGCIVNGPGEARDADIGIAGGKGKAALFRHGKIIREVDESDIIQALREEIEKIE